MAFSNKFYCYINCTDAVSESPSKAQPFPEVLPLHWVICASTIAVPVAQVSSSFIFAFFRTHTCLFAFSLAHELNGKGCMPFSLSGKLWCFKHCCQSCAVPWGCPGRCSSGWHCNQPQQTCSPGAAWTAAARWSQSHRKLGICTLYLWRENVYKWAFIKRVLAGS